MKLNLGCGTDIREQGYINIDLKPSAQYPSDVYQQGDVQSLDWLCEDQTVEEILALNVLNYVPIAQVSTTIRNWAHKLIVDGVLKIATPDIYALAKIFANNQLSTRDFVVSIFGTQQDTDACMSSTDAPTLVKILE